MENFSPIDLLIFCLAPTPSHESFKPHRNSKLTATNYQSNQSQWDQIQILFCSSYSTILGNIGHNDLGVLAFPCFIKILRIQL